MAKFSTPPIEVIFIDDNGEEKHIDRIQTIAADQFAYDMIRRNSPNFPDNREAPLLWVYILAFSALRRKKVIGEHHKFDDWIQNNLLSADVIKDDDKPAPLVES